MDLIMAHKRTMKLAELCGLSLAAQTTFATAVSEIARSGITYGRKSYVSLCIGVFRSTKKEIVATLYDQIELNRANPEGFSYASRLMGQIQGGRDGAWFTYSIGHSVPFSGTFSAGKIESFKEYFKNEPPLSPYDEIRKKNIQLIDLADKLRESEKQYRLLTDTLPLMIFAVNQRGEITFANKVLTDFLATGGLKPAGLNWLSMLHADEARAVQPEWAKALVNRTALHTQARLKQNNKSIWHMVSIVPVKNEKDVISNWIGFFADIELQKQIEAALKDNRELKETQQSLQQYQRELEVKVNELNVSNQHLEQFAYIASHDLQEPLRKIKTYSALLDKRLQLDEKDKYYFSKIVSSSDRMSALIRDVLHYSTLSHVAEEPVDINLNEVLKNVVSDFELMIVEKNAQIHIANLPVVKGHTLQFDQLFSNLLSNALKFSDYKPLIEIASRTLTRKQVKERPFLDAGQEYHEITFKDNGIGFEQQYADKIFVIFQRLLSGHNSGTGIGLALVKKIVENHKGIITAESEPNAGATFRIFLPANQNA